VSPEEEFWEHVAGGKVLFQRCSACGVLRSSPRAACHNCLSRDADWVQAPESGRIKSFFVANQHFATSLETPYTVVHVDFGDDVRLTANLIGDREPATVGMPVKLVVDVRDGTPLPQFRRASDRTG
jgi:uncharacterized OB-fold protein